VQPDHAASTLAVAGAATAPILMTTGTWYHVPFG
jgi:hypothetical protein